MPEKTHNSRLFYGWLVAIAGFAVMLTLGEVYWSFGIFFKSLESEFGWSRSQVSSGYTALTIGYAISILVTGRLIDRFSPRPIFLASAILGGLGIALCSQVQSINQLRFFLFLAGLGTGASWSVPGATVQRWFYQKPRAGLALSVVVTGVGAGALIFAPLVSYFIRSFGWRDTYIIVAVIFFIIIAGASIVIKQPAEATPSPLDSRLASFDAPQWTTRHAVFTPAFLGIMYLLIIMQLSINAVSVHLVPHATDVGISAMLAAAAQGLVGGVSVPGRLISGFIADRFGWQKIFAFSLLGMALSLILLIFMKNTWVLYSFVVLFGLCFGGMAPAQVGILSEFFGVRSLGELIGITAATGIFFSAFAPYITGFIFDVTGDYFWAFVMAAVLLTIGCIIALVIKRPTKVTYENKKSLNLG